MAAARVCEWWWGGGGGKGAGEGTEQARPGVCAHARAAQARVELSRRTSSMRRRTTRAITGKARTMSENSTPIVSSTSASGYSQGDTSSPGSIEVSSASTSRSRRTKGSRSDMKPKPPSGSSAALTPATSPWYSASPSRDCSTAGIGPGVIENLEEPLVRSGSTASEAVEAGKAPSDCEAPMVEGDRGWRGSRRKPACVARVGAEVRSQGRRQPRGSRSTSPRVTTLGRDH